VNLYLGNRAAALADAERYLTDTSWKGHSAPYAALLAHRVYRLSSRDNEARSIIDEAVAKCDKSDWTQNIFQYLQRKLTASELVALASNERERAEAHAYVGFNASLEGRTSEATSHLQWVRDRGKKGAIIYIFALKELEQRREG
jgi:lipoprotein NlpI